MRSTRTMLVRGEFGTGATRYRVIDADGVILARIDGARDWSAPIALDLLEHLSS